MRSLLQVVNGTSEAGKDLPEILPSFTAAEIKFRRGQLHVIAGQPGGGKTMLALWYAINCGENVLYFSADSDQGTMANRAAAVVMQKTVTEIKAMRMGDGNELVEAELAKLSRRLRIDPEPAPSLDGIIEETEAYCELFGTNPTLIIVDNLLNMAASHDNEWTAMRDAMSAFHGIARETDAAVLVLHHVSEEKTNPLQPAPRRALLGKVSQLPEVILTVAIDGDTYRVAAVKNRDGIADPNAKTPVSVHVDAASMTLFDTYQELKLARSRRDWK
jgi:hypothetical protein